MKQLLFDGCSFVAGDELAWNEWRTYKNLDKNLEFDKIYGIELLEYSKFRKGFNLAHHTSRLLKTTSIDLSTDGKSNDGIAATTLARLSSMTNEERQNTHVVIGWTEITRTLRWSSRNKFFQNINVSKLEPEFRDYIITSLITAAPEDSLLNYIKNVLLLENYLRNNNVTYTFFRSMGDYADFNFNKLLGPLDPTAYREEYQYLNISNNLTDVNAWVNLSDTKLTIPFLGINGESWYSSTVREDKQYQLNAHNGHPNTKSILMMAGYIASHIRVSLNIN